MQQMGVNIPNSDPFSKENDKHCKMAANKKYSTLTKTNKKQKL